MRTTHQKMHLNQTLELNSKNVWLYTGLGEIDTKLDRLFQAKQAFKAKAGLYLLITKRYSRKP